MLQKEASQRMQCSTACLSPVRSCTEQNRSACFHRLYLHTVTVLQIASQVSHYLSHKLHDSKQKTTMVARPEDFLKATIHNKPLGFTRTRLVSDCIAELSMGRESFGFGCALHVFFCCFSPDMRIFTIQVAFCRQTIQQGKLRFHCRNEIHRTSRRLNRVL